MVWRNDKPESIGDYIVLVPEITGPISNFPCSVSCSVSRAWFDGERFNLMEKALNKTSSSPIEVGMCLWMLTPTVTLSGYLGSEDANLSAI